MRKTKKAAASVRDRRAAFKTSRRATKAEPFRAWGREETEKRLFGDKSSTWSHWSEPGPSHVLKIDTIVTALREGRGKARLRSKDALERLNIKCPYYRVRKDLAYAVGYAKIETHFFQALVHDPDGSVHKLQAIKKMIAKLRSACQTEEEHGGLCGLLRQWTWGIDVTPLLHLEWNERAKVAKIADDLVAVLENLGGISTLIDEKLSSRPTGQGAPDFWKIKFVAMMGRSWHNLTGKNPASSTSKPGSLVFTDFLVAGYNTLWALCGVEEPPDVEWESAIITAGPLMKKQTNGRDDSCDNARRV